MFDHLGLLATNPEESVAFFAACLAPLGITIREHIPEHGAVIFYGESEYPFSFLGTAQGDYYGTNLETSGFRPIHLAFKAATRDTVNAFHREGLAHGGWDNGAAAMCGGGYYAAYLLDPGGNNIEAGVRE
jgi:catechol 2,3-dioxygenase-like lactoylglutathione lyase family enzyme